MSWEPAREASGTEPGADHLSRKVANGGGSEGAATAARPSPVAGANTARPPCPFYLIIHGPAHRGANGAATPTDEEDQDGPFFFNHPERGGYSAA